MKNAISGSGTIRTVLAGLVMTLAVATTATAQSAKGAIMGNAMTGDTIVVDRVDGGFHRELVASKDGKYYFRAVSPGRYQVVVKRADGTALPAKIIVVQVGTTARVK